MKGFQNKKKQNNILSYLEDPNQTIYYLKQTNKKPTKSLFYFSHLETALSVLK